MNLEEQKLELERCKNDPFYFYDNYVSLEEGTHRMSREEFEGKMKAINMMALKSRSIGPTSTMILASSRLYDNNWINDAFIIQPDADLLEAFANIPNRNHNETYPVYDIRPLPSWLDEPFIEDDIKNKYLGERTGTKDCNMSSAKRKALRNKRKKKNR